MTGCSVKAASRFAHDGRRYMKIAKSHDKIKINARSMQQNTGKKTLIYNKINAGGRVHHEM